MNKKLSIAPSILAADFAHLGKDLQACEKAGADYIHIDVMDGHFVPNLTIGIPVVASLKKVCKIPFDTHLMIENPEKYAEAFIKAGSDMLTFHIEATEKPEELIEKIKKLGAKAGVSLRPGTDLEILTPYLKDLDLVLVMTVEPGFGGQSFMTDQVSKIEKLNQIRKEQNLDFMISVDGGISKETGKVCVDAGVDILVAGSYIFKNDIDAAINELRSLSK